jgi:hypothetical protein
MRTTARSRLDAGNATAAKLDARGGFPQQAAEINKGANQIRRVIMARQLLVWACGHE